MWFEPFLSILHIIQTLRPISFSNFLVIPPKPSERFQKCLKSISENRKTDLTRITGNVFLHEKLWKKECRRDLELRELGSKFCDINPFLNPNFVFWCFQWYFLVFPGRFLVFPVGFCLIFPVGFLVFPVGLLVFPVGLK